MINIVSVFPFLIAIGAIVLFIMGYVSNSMMGNNSPVEQIAEELLNKEYNIDVEFSGKEIGRGKN